MTQQPIPSDVASDIRDPRDWVKVLAAYRDPNWKQSWFEVFATAAPFLVLWGLAWWALSVSYLLAFVISLANGVFLVRLFTIQHDCGHGSFFASRDACDWLGRVLGVVTLTPYAVWRRTHSIHHSSAGNLGRRGIGDIHTMTVSEFEAQGWFGQQMYRLYRNPVILFGLGPIYIFFLQNRVPLGLMKIRKYWYSAMLTNLVLALVLVAIYLLGGWAPILLIFVPSTLMAATIGMWLFYVQHQFEHAHWDEEEEWDLHNSALHGSSYYVMPKVLQWLSANIGIHHVHHLYSRIPFYRLPEVLKDHAELAQANRMTIRESFASVRLHLWDEQSRKLLSFRQARALTR
ncbi:Fatty acid desaturase [Pelagimonas phthalicica]|uniref:Fatty acid desaturase n=1 Tax=Pelagimonas phthalicica TaxID=1037362 RepID=A0A238JH14_9RHOB|nr:fatty acid desaturase [Pelagimonas phthalicica]TDS89792.1 omega-6 fatty acid desaturase (delta-12 desaturase) [Pelagimonas phthalicica]SMX29960.1 Fatty acid desaturase [Pelagimonas phthalicica]